MYRPRRGAAQAVEAYYRLTAAGDYQSAWRLIHPYASRSPQELEAVFVANQGQTGPALASASAPVWAEEWKYAGCMCHPPNVVAIDVVLSDGAKRRVHAATSHGGWGLFWSQGEGLR